MTYRFITEDDYPLLEQSLAKDEYHKDTTLDFFIERGTVCSVFEDEKGIVLFVRGKPIIDYDRNIGMIQLDIQYLNNFDVKRNMKTMLKGFANIEEKAKENGFSGFFFNSTAPALKRFCIKYLGFEDYGDFLVKVFNKNGLDEVERECYNG